MPAFAVLCGDVDGNGQITAADARTVFRASVSIETLTTEQAEIADVDGTPGITAADARLILRASVTLEVLGELEEVLVHVYDKVISVDRPQLV